MKAEKHRLQHAIALAYPKEWQRVRKLEIPGIVRHDEAVPHRKVEHHERSVGLPLGERRAQRLDGLADRHEHKLFDLSVAVLRRDVARELDVDTPRTHGPLNGRMMVLMPRLMPSLATGS